MFSVKRLFRRARSTDADNQFKRFLKLNYRRYARLCINESAEPSSGSEDIAAACREWLPSLSKAVHRDICASIAAYHGATTKQETALGNLMIALDRLLDESPDEHVELVRASTSSLARGKSQLMRQHAQAVDHSVIDLGSQQEQQELCSYCGSAPGRTAPFLSGPNAWVCDSNECVSKHDNMLRAEARQFFNGHPDCRSYH